MNAAIYIGVLMTKDNILSNSITAWQILVYKIDTIENIDNN